MAVSGQRRAYHVSTSLEDGLFSPLREPNGMPLLLTSSVAPPIWTETDFFARSIRLHPISSVEGEEVEDILVLVTLCLPNPSPLSFDDSPIHVDTQQTELVSMYENELRILFRTYRSSIFFFSSSSQGDLLVAQLVHGSAQIIFDFGSLSAQLISGGRALDDGEWHSIRWLHQFDSVELFVDGVLTNHSAPSGLYRKLDLGHEVTVGGRGREETRLLPPSLPLEDSFRGCMYRAELNGVDLLGLGRASLPGRCSMARPPSITISSGSHATIPFSFHPFAFEFRILRQESTLMSLLDAGGQSLATISVHSHSLVLVSNSSGHRQSSNPPIDVSDGAWHHLGLKIRGTRMDIDIDGMTVLWLEGNEVRSMGVSVASVRLSAEGCYRSTSVDLGLVQVGGTVIRGSCGINDECTPNPCQNGGTCVQSSLASFSCTCPKGYGGAYCQKTDAIKSCEQYYASRPTRTSSKAKKMVIDLDGGFPLPPLVVHCSSRRNSHGEVEVATRLDHDMAETLRVEGVKEAGAVRRDLDYSSSPAQLDAFVDSFHSCSQWMGVECRGGARLMSWEGSRTPSTWYTSRGEAAGLQWGSAPPFSRMCSCAVYSNCTYNEVCNCDSGEDAVDEGTSSFSELLPVTSLFVGGTSLSSSLSVSIGPLVCTQKKSFQSITFMDRRASLEGKKSFLGVLFSVSLQLKFTHTEMNILTWKSTEGSQWYNLRVGGGGVVGEISLGGDSAVVSSPSPINDGEWHSIVWEAHSESQRMVVDGRESVSASPAALPRVYKWLLGSSSPSIPVGFAGVLREVFLCEEGLSLRTLAREQQTERIVEGSRGKCNPHRCSNGGACVDHFDSFSCDCSATPFGGESCSEEEEAWVPVGSSVSIPWQHPSHSSPCHRIAFLSSSSNFSLIRSRSLFADGSMNLTVDKSGLLSISIAGDNVFDAKEKQTFGTVNVSDGVAHDVSFCASVSEFRLTVDGSTAFDFTGNFSFVDKFNAWKILDENFVGCLSRLHIGGSFPLKNNNASRLKTSGSIRFGSCQNSLREGTLRVSPSSGVSMSTLVEWERPSLGMSLVLGGGLLLLLFLALSTLICYMRSRPEGVYKTNEERREESVDDNSATRPLNTTTPEREYFC